MPYDYADLIQSSPGYKRAGTDRAKAFWDATHKASEKVDSWPWWKKGTPAPLTTEAEECTEDEPDDFLSGLRP